MAWGFTINHVADFLGELMAPLHPIIAAIIYMIIIFAVPIAVTFFTLNIFNRKGYCEFHPKHVEITLNGKGRYVRYENINSINDYSYGGILKLVIRINGEPNIRLRSPIEALSMKGYTSLSHFSVALKQRHEANNFNSVGP